ncbi:hypothetical protein IQ268_13840 [Oculatella sp. LEGE 06141]|uniref:hypothetical protein n=1 Tax=Oculatella sp. LEGE 06141 TaxID=1828648 RepID=UPI0018829EAA|nr:hypothetical protein [Oculatella sp. LEGE 06141]MBE9179645.1 hypothetical protein [Oculatella sp. LEGE 06141]
MNKLLDEPLSLDLAAQIKSKAKTPFENAYKAALVTEGATYVQGFLAMASQPYQPIEHGWLEQGDRIIDPSLPHLAKNPQELYYFPAQRLTVKQLKAAIEEAKEDYPEDNPLPIYGASPYEYYGDVMLGGKDYLDAHQAATAQCQELVQRHAEQN